MKVWLDDLREPPDNTWEWAVSFKQFRHVLRHFGERPELISFDHDLGYDISQTDVSKSPTGYDCLKWLSEQHPEWYPETVSVHSANPIGAENIRKYDEWYRRMIEGG